MKHIIARHISNNDSWVDMYYESITKAKKANPYFKDFLEVID